MRLLLCCVFPAVGFSPGKCKVENVCGVLLCRSEYFPRAHTQTLGSSRMAFLGSNFISALSPNIGLLGVKLGGGGGEFSAGF